MVFQTNRLWAKFIENDDEESFYRMKSDETVTCNYFQKPLSYEESRKKLQQLIDFNKNEVAYTYAVFEKSSNKFIGTICLWNLEPDKNTGEIGYELLSEYQRQGYMSEILPVFVRYMLDTYGYICFTACPDEENIPSNRLLIRSGFIFNGKIESSGHCLNNYVMSFADNFTTNCHEIAEEKSSKTFQRQL